MNKCIVFTEKDKAELISEPVKAVGDNEVAVRLHYSTISAGTERANLIGELNIAAGVIPKSVVFPRRAGYSAYGTVIERGKKVTRVAVGGQVLGTWGNHNLISGIYETGYLRSPRVSH